MKFTGTHIMGRGRARTLGFPTINLHDLTTLVIEDGVYAARVKIQNNHYMAALFVGDSPTFRDKDKTVEVHLIGLTEEVKKKYHLDSLRATKVEVETVRYIRPIKKFKSREELIQNIESDIKEIEKILNEKNYLQP